MARASDQNSLSTVGPTIVKSSTWKNHLIDKQGYTTMRNIGLGLRFRNLVLGPEQDLIDGFLNSVCSKTKKGQRLTVFSQPSIGSCYPDIVAVLWDEQISKDWPIEREKLTSNDLKLIHTLFCMGPSKSEKLETILGSQVKKNISTLLDLDMISFSNKKYKINNIKKIFAVNKIIAVEAKIAFGQKVIEQAGHNTWFSSNSHALLPKVSDHKSAIIVADRLQIGLVTFDNQELNELHKAPTRIIPLSYGSWLFNEWVWRLDNAIR